MDTHQVTTNQKGGLGEALLKSHDQEVCRVLRPWIYSDLYEHEGLAVPTPDALNLRRCSLDKTCDKHHWNPFDNASGWYPDAHFIIGVPIPDMPDAGKRPIHFDYVFEIKTGTAASLTDSQRKVMEHLESTDSQVVPVRARVDVSGLPEEYGLTLTRIHDRWTQS